MAIQSSGQISIVDIATEFSDSPPHALNEFYRGGGKVPTNNTNVPTSGQIAFNNFYGAVNRLIINIIISSDTANYVLSPLTVPGYISGISDITLTINSGVFVYSTSTSNAGLTVGNFNSGDTINIINNGYIMGMGGAGGGEGRNNGGNGGDALSIQNNITMWTSQGGYAGLYAGGGGGGGSRGLYTNESGGYVITGGGGGAGGGAGGNANGFVGGSGGNPSNSGNSGQYSSGSNINYINRGTGKSVAGGGGGRKIGTALVDASSFSSSGSTSNGFQIGTSYEGGAGGGNGGIIVGGWWSAIGGGDYFGGVGGQGRATTAGSTPNFTLPYNFYVPSNAAAGGGGGGYGQSGGSGVGTNVQNYGGAFWFAGTNLNNFISVSSGGSGGRAIVKNGYTLTLSNTPPIIYGSVV